MKKYRKRPGQIKKIEVEWWEYLCRYGAGTVTWDHFSLKISQSLGSVT